MGPQFGETAYISEVNGAKVKSNAQVATSNNSDPMQKISLMGGWGGRCPQLNFYTLPELSETIRARKPILGLQVNIDNNII